MILRATIPPRPLADVEQSWPVEPDFGWNGETTGGIIEMDAVRFVETLRGKLEVELQNARHSWGGDNRDRVARTPRFRSQAAFNLWLDEQINAGEETIELSDFQCVDEYPECWNDLILMNPWGLSHGVWTMCLLGARCPACGISYAASDLREIEYDLFFGGEYVLVCQRGHHLWVVGWEVYQLGG